MTAVYKEYNVDRSRFLGEPEEKGFFNPILICGGVGVMNGTRSTCLFIIHSEGVVEKISDYATAGSGAAYAELLLKNYYSEKMTVKEATPLIAYAIGEVKDIDPNCGGETKVTIITTEGVKDLNQKDISNTFNTVRPLLDNVGKILVPKILRGELDGEKLEEILR